MTENEKEKYEATIWFFQLASIFVVAALLIGLVIRTSIENAYTSECVRYGYASTTVIESNRYCYRFRPFEITELDEIRKRFRE